MDKDKLVLAIIANSGNSFTESDRDTLMGLSELGLVAALQNKIKLPKAEPINNSDAVEVVEKSGSFVINAVDKALLDDIKEQKIQERTDLINAIVSESSMTTEQLEKLDDSTLVNMKDSISSKAQDYSLKAAKVTNSGKTNTFKLVEGA